MKEIFSKKCAKQVVIAIIENQGKFYIGINWCRNPQIQCPRGNLPSGVGYELCKEICEQDAHAEVNACKKAGINAKGGILYLIGHTYSCKNCQKIMKQFGIKKLIIGKYPNNLKKKEYFDE